MRLLLSSLFILALGLSAPVMAQDQAEEDKSFIEDWLQENLSDAGRNVTVTGFRGALSSNATLESLTIADGDGVWFTMRDASLVWSRAALLRGRLEVDELTAGEIILERLPPGGEGVSTEDAEATQFSLPDLPVSVNIELIQAENIRLGEAVIGEAASLSLEGTVALADGDGAATLDIRRLDRDDRLTFDGAFSNESRVLKLDLDFEEAREGIVSSLLNIPETPALRLQVTGEAPLSDYTARIVLSSDGQRRFGGAVGIAAIDGDDTQGYAFSADLDGDLRPLFAQDFQPFFGEATELDVAGQTLASGRLVLDELQIQSEALDLSGNLALSPSGWPETLSLRGRVGGDEGEIRLPVSGAPTILRNAEITARFDAARNDQWDLEARVTDLTRDGFSVDLAQLTGSGRITPAPGQSLSGAFTFETEGVDHTDDALARAIGDAPAGSLSLDWRPDQPLVISDLDLQSGDVTLTGEGRLESLEDGFPFTGSAVLEAADLSRFAAISNRDIAGAANATLEGTGTLLGGAFDIELSAETTDLQVGEPRLDPLLTGDGALSLVARRDTAGTVLERLTVETPALSANASGRLDADDGQLDLAARLENIAQVEPRLSGPATLDTSFDWRSGDALNIARLEATAAGATLTANGAVFPENPDLPAEGELTLVASDLSRFAGLTGQDLAGAVNATVRGNGAIIGGTFDIELDTQTDDLRVGQPRLDPLLAGDGTVALAARRDDSGVTFLERLAVRLPEFTADASGQLELDDVRLELAARVEDLSQIEARMSGPATLDTAFRWQQGEEITISRLEADAAGAALSAIGVLAPEDALFPVRGELSLSAEDLSRLAPLAGRPLTGQVRMTLEGEGQLRGRVFDVTTEIDGSNLRTGLAELDRLIAGSVDARASVALGDDAPGIRYINLQTPRVTVDAEGSGPGAPVDLSARLSDLALLVPGFPGPVAANGTVTIVDRRGEQIRVSLDASGPGGTSARVNGAIDGYGRNLDLDVTGSAPLGLANRFIAPRSVAGTANFDLSLNGPPALNSLTGIVNVSGGRLSLPSFSAALTGLAGTVRLASGRAEADITGSAGTGGGFRLRGPITLSAPFNANLETTLNDLVVTDPDLYTTTLSGQIGINGPLTGGATIGGTVNLGRTELRVPSGSGTRTPGDIADITHVNEPAAVRQTRARAGIIGQRTRQVVPYPLDLTINAPNRIFVRGRGLDAELGGRLRLGGTTANVVASGLFELIRGRLDILGRRLVLTEGVIDLRGALDPYLRFVAETESDGITVRTIIEGLASSPSVRFESVPDLPQDEAVARLLFGRGLDSISPFQAAQLVAAAATLSGQRSGGLTGGLRSAFGLSDFDVSTSDEGATQVRAGAYLSENLYSEVTADSEGNQEINLNLDLSKTLTVKGSTSTTGNTGVGIFFEKDY